MNWIETLSALLAPTVAVVTLYIAFQQYRIGRQKVRHDLFERRYAVYEAIRDFLYEAIREATLSESAFFQLNKGTDDALFLFDESVEEYIQTVREKGARLRFINGRLADTSLPVGQERSQLAEEDTELVTWFSKQPAHLKRILRKHMRLTQ